MDHINAAVEQDFGLKAPIISTWLENRMEDLAEEWNPIACEKQAEFQSTLELLAYPFLACYKALIDTDVSEKQAWNYCRKIWKKQKTCLFTVFHGKNEGWQVFYIRILIMALTFMTRRRILNLQISDTQTEQFL